MRDFQVPNGLEAMGFKFSDIGKIIINAVLYLTATVY